MGGARRASVLVALTVGLTVAACGTSPADPPAAQGHGPADPALSSATDPGPAQPPGPADVNGGLDAFYKVPTTLNPAPPGSIIRWNVIPSAGQLPPGATAYRILYHSESIAGNDVAVSGVIVVPGGAPPPGGFPIVSWAHGTTGLASQCVPSLGPLSSISYLAPLLRARMIVAATDYQGLGSPGIQPYLVGQSEAQGVLDAARAARNLEGSAASNAVVVLGYSQGGQAALFAGQIAQSYAPELFLAGVVAVGPVTSLTELAPAVPDTDADADAGFAAMALYAWSQTYGNLPLASALTARARRDDPLIATSCAGAVGAALDSTATRLLFRSDWSTERAVRSDDAVNEPGRAPSFAPVMVVQGVDDSLVPYRTTTTLVDHWLCRTQHDTVTYVPIPGASHSGALQEGGPVILDWIWSRLAGRPDVDSCRS
jgi:pimeloyl-ACP methyl ester carboxylesterase